MAVQKERGVVLHPQLWANKIRKWLLAGLGVIGAAYAFAASQISG